MPNVLKSLLTLIMALAFTASVWALSLQEAAERVARQYDAKVVSARTTDRGGRRVHVIRILTKEGVVRTIRVSADRD